MKAICFMEGIAVLSTITLMSLIVIIVTINDDPISKENSFCMVFPVSGDCLQFCGCIWCDRGNETSVCYSSSKDTCTGGKFVTDYDPSCDEERERMIAIHNIPKWVCIGSFTALVILIAIVAKFRLTCVGETEVDAFHRELDVLNNMKKETCATEL